MHRTNNRIEKRFICSPWIFRLVVRMTCRIIILHQLRCQTFRLAAADIRLPTVLMIAVYGSMGCPVRIARLFWIQYQVLPRTVALKSVSLTPLYPVQNGSLNPDLVTT